MRSDLRGWMSSKARFSAKNVFFRSEEEVKRGFWGLERGVLGVLLGKGGSIVS